MGLLFSQLYNLYEYFGGSGHNSRILMLGLDGAGKTSTLYKVKLNETVTTIPTIGMNVETVSPSSGVTFTVWDVGGQEKIRCLWRRYFENSEGLFFIVDSSDRERIEEVKLELFEILKSDLLCGVPVQIIANKQDLPNAMTPAEMTDKLELNSLQGRKWHVQGACALTGDGIWESFETMSRLVKDFNKTVSTVK